jgi:hypothetical protein
VEDYLWERRNLQAQCTIDPASKNSSSNAENIMKYSKGSTLNILGEEHLSFSFGG